MNDEQHTHTTKTAERLARIEAHQEFNAKESAEIRKTLSELAATIKTMLDDRDRRLRAVEFKVWYASGCVAVLSTLAPAVLKKFGV